MFDFIYKTTVNHIMWLLPPIIVILLICCVYCWRRRYMYYYGSKIPGPFAFPFIGSIHLVADGPKGIHKFLLRLYDKYQTVFKIWLGPDLYVSTTQPHHLKIILTSFLDKGNFYHLMSEYFQRALAAAPVDIWKKNRKNVNPTFNVSLINSFVDSFVQQADILADNLEKKCEKETDDIFPLMWKCTLDAACGTLADVNPAILRTQDFLPAVFRIEEILLQRFFNPIHHLNIFWTFSSLKKELLDLWRQNCSFIQKIIDLTELHDYVEDTSLKKRFLHHLMDQDKNKQLTHDYVLEEGQIMFFVGTETSAVALSSALLVLGMYPDIQTKIDEELSAIFGTSDRKPTLEDINRLDYLERVIKETMRLLPPIPFVMRSLDKNLQLDSYTLPAGAKVIIPIAIVHRNKEIWPDPLKFDPDRFLPEEVEKRPPCSYMPFSYGIRNCIGYRYALLSLKVILSTLLRRYKVTSSNYKTIEDIDLIIHVVAKPKLGYKITLERKNK